MGAADGLERRYAYAIQFEPLGTACYCSKAKDAARRSDGELIIEPGHEAKRSRGWIGDAQHGFPVNLEGSYVRLPLQYIVVPCRHIDREKSLVGSAEALHPAGCRARIAS